MAIDPEIRKQLDLKLAKGEISAEEYDLMRLSTEDRTTVEPQNTP